MTTLQVYIKERLEEIRSRLTVLESSETDLEQNFWSVFEAFYSRDISPPYLFPVSSFQRLSSFARTCRLRLESVDISWTPFQIAHQLNLLDTMSRDLLCEINRLQNVFNNRCSGLGKLKQIEFHPVAEFEYGTLCKAYSAVDALTFELVRRTMGSAWINSEKYVPISLFDDKGYMINLYSYVVSIPYYDNFRSRFWTILAHEVGHVLVSHQAGVFGPLNEIMLQGHINLIEELGIEEYSAALQIAELTSDVIASYVCPALFLSSLECNSMTIPIELRPGQLAEGLSVASHPPSDSRLVAMEKTLELQSILEVDDDLNKIDESARIFFARKNLVISPRSQDFIEKYNSLATRYAEKVVGELPHLGAQGFDATEWSSCSQLFRSHDISYLSPLHVLTIVWMKRLSKTKNEGSLSLQNFFDRRQGETKTFEYTVDQMYKYYESQMMPKVRARNYDLRFDFDQR